MPILPENRPLYPSDWALISRRIRVERAGERCEWEGCGAVNGRPHPLTGSRVVLTCAHLDHDPQNCDEANLAAWCQLHHNRYDREHRRQTRRARRAWRDLFAGAAPGAED